MSLSTRRAAHAVVAVAAALAVLWQLMLVARGGRVLDETLVPPLGTRLVRFISYFTVLSNILVLVTSWLLAADPVRDGRWWRLVRVAAMTGIAITGVVHWFLLRPLLDLHGADAAVDKLLHVVVPLLAVAAWLAADPHGRLGPRDAVVSLAWPVAWTGYTLVRGGLVDWYPYPFIDVGELGWGRIVGNIVGISVLFAAVAFAFVGVDHRMRAGTLRAMGDNG